jgi:DUF1009 family protein
MQIMGLIAGNGKFPFLFARAAKDQGMRVVAAAVRGDTSIFLRFFVDEIAWFHPGDLKKVFSYFREHNVRYVTMAGQVDPDHLFDSSVKPDAEFQALFDALQDRKADTILAAVADRLKANGLDLLDSTRLLKKYLAPKGTLTSRAPTEVELKDIVFGFDLAKTMGGIDIGQTVVVKERAIVAIEAMEGTDRAILRGSRIARQGAVVVKTSKPKQDDRFDVPVIGPRTIQTMVKGKAACLAIEAGRTLIFDRELCVRLANRHKICIVAM